MKTQMNTIGIQGSRGSFNHKAIVAYLSSSDLPRAFDVAFLDNTGPVIKALRSGQTQLGQFAIVNNNGGVVRESLEELQSLAKGFSLSIGLFARPYDEVQTAYKADPQKTTDSLMQAWESVLPRLGGRLVSAHTIEVGHDLMIHPQASLEKITEIRTHEQVALQCGGTLNSRYPHIKVVPGKEDAGMIAAKLAAGEFPTNVAILGNGVIAQLNGLVIIDRGLQDKKNNKTTMLLIAV